MKEVGRGAGIGAASVNPFKLSFWHPDRLGDRIFGRRIHRCYVRRHNRLVVAFATVLSGVADLFGKFAPFSSMLLLVSLAVFGMFLVNWLVRRTSGSLAGMSRASRRALRSA